MLGFDSPHDEQPVTWWRGYPIHSAVLLVIVHVAAMLAATIAIAAGAGGIVNSLIFDSSAVLNGQIWRPFTYAFVHIPDNRLLWFAIEMYLLWVFGREVERFFGRRAFFQLYATLLLVTPLVLTFFGLSRPMQYVGSGSLHLSLFVAFAAIHPRAPMIFNITAFWAAVILLAINSLQFLGANAWAYLVALWASAGAAWAWVRWAKGDLTLPSIKLFEKKPKFRVLPDPKKEPPRRAPRAEDASFDDIDPILDKIARSGMDSLTPAEKALLEKARAALLKKDPSAQ